MMITDEIKIFFFFFLADLVSCSDECVLGSLCVFMPMYICVISHREQMESCFFTALFGSL